jgi:hypothetical protein
VDEERAKGVDRGLLHGIPISLKDDRCRRRGHDRGLARARGPHRAQGRTRRHAIARAGAIVCKTNLHEFALGTTSEDSASARCTTRGRVTSAGGSAVDRPRPSRAAWAGVDWHRHRRIDSHSRGSLRHRRACRRLGRAHRGRDSAQLIARSRRPLAQSVEDAALLWAILANRPMPDLAPGRRSIVTTRAVARAFDSPWRRRRVPSIGRRRWPPARPLSARIAVGPRHPRAYVNVVLPEGRRGTASISRRGASTAHSPRAIRRPGDPRDEIRRRPRVLPPAAVRLTRCSTAQMPSSCRRCRSRRR